LFCASEYQQVRGVDMIGGTVAAGAVIGACRNGRAESGALGNIRAPSEHHVIHYYPALRMMPGTSGSACMALD
jgi:hypothetical protein